MKNKTILCYIFAAGDYKHNSDIINFNNDNFIIAADAGFSHALKCECIPNIIIGDFDSLENIPNDIEKIHYPAKKDYTDTHLAIEYAYSKGYRNIYVLGALGGERFDHSFSNIQSGTHFANLGANITLTDGKTVIKFLRNSKISFDKSMSGYISIFSATDTSSGVNVKGLEYELEDYTLKNDFPLGVSNKFIGKPSEISVTDGTLIVILQYKKP